jgi:hypothetical protein
MHYFEKKQNLNFFNWDYFYAGVSFVLGRRLEIKLDYYNQNQNR